jgi:hypothetical protein
VKLGPLFRSRKRVDAHALERALAAPLPEGAPDVPFHQRLPLTDATWAVVMHVLFAAFVLAAALIEDPEYRPSPLEMTIIVCALSVIFVAALVSGGLNPGRSLEVSGEGVRLRRMFTTTIVPWWYVTGVVARPDLSELRIDATPLPIDVRLSGLPEEARAGVVNAIRARLPAGITIGPGAADRFGRGWVTNGLGVLGAAGLLATLYAHPFLSGGTLGMRCSGPSAYFDARFRLPPGRGCVVIRVSGSAQRAGVRQGDRLIAMNGAPITSGVQFNNRFFDEDTRRYTLTLVRAGEPAPIEISFRTRSGPSPSSPDSDPLTWFLRARGNPDTKKAIAYYGRAIELEPGFDLAYLYRGELMLESGDIEQQWNALPDLQRALELDPNSAEANRALGEYYTGQIFVDPTVPKTYMARAIELHACDGGFTGKNLDCEIDYSDLANLLRFRTETQASIDAAEKALTYYPAAVQPLYELALSYEILGDKKAAAAYARNYIASGSADRTSGGASAMRALIRRVDA